MTSASDNIAYVELHDGRVGGVTLQSGGLGTVDLAHVVAYCQVDHERYDVWSYRAALHFRGITGVELTGALDQAEFVLDGTILNDGGQSIELTALLVERPIQSVELYFGSGARLCMRATYARLELLEPLRKLEQWQGPLRGA
jgi:hypothetical protein